MPRNTTAMAAHGGGFSVATGGNSARFFLVNWGILAKRGGKTAIRAFSPFCLFWPVAARFAPFFPVLPAAAGGNRQRQHGNTPPPPPHLR